MADIAANKASKESTQDKNDATQAEVQKPKARAGSEYRIDLGNFLQELSHSSDENRSGGELPTPASAPALNEPSSTVSEPAIAQVTPADPEVDRSQTLTLRRRHPLLEKYASTSATLQSQSEVNRTTQYVEEQSTEGKLHEAQTPDKAEDNLATALQLIRASMSGSAANQQATIQESTAQQTDGATNQHEPGGEAFTSDDDNPDKGTSTVHQSATDSQRSASKGEPNPLQAPNPSPAEGQDTAGNPQPESFEWIRDQLVECFDIGFNLFIQIANPEQETDTNTWMETWHMAHYLVNRMIEVAAAKPEVLMDVAINLEREPRDIAKLVHTCLLAINTGMGLEYDSSQLLNLGVSALLHDIGMFELPKSVQQAIRLGNRQLTSRERTLMGQHIILGVQRLRALLGDQVSGDILAGIYQHHERIDGSGYPDQKRESEIHEFAQIIGVANAYEAITHAKQKTPHEAMREIIGLGGKSYSRKITRTFVDQAAIFPVGSLILLENDRIGKVISSNKDYPLCPVLLMLVNNRTHQKIDNPYVLDLARNMNLNIRQSVNPDKIDIDPIDVLYATVTLRQQEQVYVPSTEDLEARSRRLQRELEVSSADTEQGFEQSGGLDQAGTHSPASGATYTGSERNQAQGTASRSEMEKKWESIKTKLNRLTNLRSKRAWPRKQNQ
ncbi:MAG: HD domain-containing protein [Candidatus Poribacteria bacterium]|nr:HD domain-containing protein [Candidatus Poribacteria bacterium]